MSRAGTIKDFDSDLLTKDTLDNEAQALAADILRQDKSGRIKKVKVEIKKTVKTEKKASDKPGGKVEEKAEDGKEKKGEEAGGGEKNGDPSTDSTSSQQAGSPRQDSGQAGQGEEAGEEKKSQAEDESETKKNFPAGGGPSADSTGSRQAGQGEEAEERKDDEAGGKKDGGGEKSDPSTDSAISQQAGSGQENKGEEKKSQVEDKPEAKKDFPAGGGKGATPDSATAGEETPDGAAGKLREERKNKDGEEDGDKPGAADEPQSLRQRVRNARQAMNLEEQAKGKLKEKVTAPAKLGLNELLKQAWINLPDSFGLTLIWINIHVFLKWVLGETLFCKLGDEWLPKQIAQAGGDASEPVGRGIGLVEVIVLLILDLIVLCVILVVLALIVMIVDFMQAGILKQVKMTIGGLTSLGWGGIKVLYDLFAPKLLK